MAAEMKTEVTIEVPAGSPDGAVRLDGSGNDPIWARAVALPVLTQDGRPEDPAIASRAQVVRAGSWLLFALEAREPVEIVARESMHGAQQWHEDAFGLRLEGTQTLSVMVNPLGALWPSVAGKRSQPPLVKESKIRAASRVGFHGWRAEVAIDLTTVLTGGQSDRIGLRLLRQRQQRGLQPFAEPLTKATLILGADWKKNAPILLDVAAPQRFGGKSVLRAGRCATAPADEAAWAKMPATMLQPDNGKTPLDPSFQPTVVRAAITAEDLLLEVLCKEPHLDKLEESGEAMWKEDNVEVFVGPANHNYLQVAASPGGKFGVSRGKTGGRGVRGITPPTELQVKAEKGKDAWTVFIRIPLAVVMDKVGASPKRHPDVYPWNIQITRNRPERSGLGQQQQVSTLAVTHSGTSHCPNRYAALRPVVPATEAVSPPEARKPALPSPVLTAQKRKAVGATTLLRNWSAARTAEMHRKWQKEFDVISDAAGWKAYAAKIRTNLMKAMFPTTDGETPKRRNLNDEIIYDHDEEGFRVQGLVIESRPGFPMPATLYVPEAKPAKKEKRPALIMIPAHHTSRNSRDLNITGANFALAGGVALATESICSGERSVTAPWEHRNYQRHMTGVQMTLAGEVIAGWTAFDISRMVDYLLARGDVDPNRIGIVGAVAGGGDISALAAAVDERINVSIPFNFHSEEPMGAWYDPIRCYTGAHAGGFSAWMVDAMIAPRRLIQANEFAWNDVSKQRHARFQKVYGWLNATDDLAYLHGGPNTHATHFNYMHRMPMYKILNKWWGMTLPEKRKDEVSYRIHASKTECYQTAKGGQYLERLREKKKLREPHELSAELARKSRKSAARKPAALRAAVDRLLGDTTPHGIDPAKLKSSAGKWKELQVEKLWLPAEPTAEGKPALGLAMWVISKPDAKGPNPLVLGIAQSGKARFLAERAAQVKSLVDGGATVALLDVRGTGETAPGPSRLPEGRSASLAVALWHQIDCMPARRVKDVRTALALLANRKEIDAARIALWGEGFSEPNGVAGRKLLFEETGFRQTSPTPKRLVEPTGAWVATLAAMYPVESQGKQLRIRAVVARGGVHAFESVLADRHHYLPVDSVVPGLLREADVVDIVKALQGMKVVVIVEDLRDGSNRIVSGQQLKVAWGDVAPSPYATHPSDAAIARLAKLLKK